MKWVLLTGVVVVTVVAGVYTSVATGRERTFRRLIDTGDAAMARGDGYEAIEAFSGAIAHKPDSMLGYLKRGEAYARRGEYDEALRDLRRATDLDPGSPRAQELAGDVNYTVTRYDRAAHRYQAYLRLDDRSPRILYKLALAHYSAGQPTAAIAALKKAIALEETFAEAHYLFGLCLRDTQGARAALGSLERSVELAPTTMLQAREELADLYGTLGRHRDRIKQLESLLAFDGSAAREVALGLAYAEAGRLENAVLRLGEASERYPDQASIYVALGRVWLETAQRDTSAVSRRVSLAKALGALQAAVANPTSEALTLQGRALLMSDADAELAQRTLQRATEVLPVEPTAFFHLAEAAERRGQLDLARRALIDYHALGAADADTRRRAVVAQRIAELSMRVHDPATAVTWYERASEASDEPALLTRLADALLRSGNPAAARATLERVIEKDPENRAARALLRQLARQGAM